MNPIVIYTSKTGFTEKYARWIAEALHCPLLPLKQADQAQLTGCSPVIYGGPLMAGKIAGLNKLKAQLSPGQRLLVFATGATPQNGADTIAKARNDNFSREEHQRIPFFYLEGGIDYDKMSFFNRFILKTMGKAVARKEHGDADSSELSHMFKPHDGSSRDYLAPLLAAVQTDTAP